MPCGRLPGLRQNQCEFVAPEARRGIGGPAGPEQRLGDAANCEAAREVAVAVVDLLQAIEVEQDHGQRLGGAARALNFGFERLHQLPVIGEPGQRIGDCELAPRSLNIALHRDDGREHEARHGRHAGPHLQQHQRFVRAVDGERTHMVHRAQNRDDRDDEHRRRRFARAEAERDPDHHGPQDHGERVVARGEHAAEQRERHQRRDHGQRDRFDRLTAAPARRRLDADPENQRRCDNDVAHRITEPPGQRNPRSVHPGHESPQRE